MYHRAKPGPKCPDCRNDLWEILGEKATCTNCMYERPFIRREPQAHTVSPSQFKVASLIYEMFESEYAGKKYGIEKAVITTTEYGSVWLSIETGGSFFVSEGAFIKIGRRGGVEVTTLYGFRDHRLKWWNERTKRYVNNWWRRDVKDRRDKFVVSSELDC